MAPEIDFINFSHQEKKNFDQWLSDKVLQGATVTGEHRVVSPGTGIMTLILIDGEPLVTYQDNIFAPSTGKIYCSERIAEELRAAGIIPAETAVAHRNSKNK